MRWLVCVALVTTGCDLVFTLKDPTQPGGPPVSAERCEDAAPITLPAVFERQSTLDAEDDFNCQACIGAETRGPDLVYQIQVPARNRVIATVTPVGDYDPAVTVAKTCSEPQVVDCSGGVDGPNGVVETLVFNNTGETTSVFFVVDGFENEPAGEFDLSFQTAALVPGDVCGNALPESPQASTLNAANDYRGCNGVDGDGPDVVMNVVIPGDAVTAFTIMPQGFQASVYLIRSPEESCTWVPTCFTSAIGPNVGSPVTLTVDNLGGDQFTGFLVIDGVDADDAGDFTVVR